MKIHIRETKEEREARTIGWRIRAGSVRGQGLYACDGALLKGHGFFWSPDERLRHLFKTYDEAKAVVDDLTKCREELKASHNTTNSSLASSLIFGQSKYESFPDYGDVDRNTMRIVPVRRPLPRVDVADVLKFCEEQEATKKNERKKGEPSRGLQVHRFADNPEEKRFADAWTRRNRGQRTLPYLLHVGSQGGGIFVAEPTRREHAVAATVIQWLGSPVGQGFLEDLGYEKTVKKTAESIRRRV